MGKYAIKTSGATQFPWVKTQQDEQKSWLGANLFILKGPHSLLLTLGFTYTTGNRVNDTV